MSSLFLSRQEVRQVDRRAIEECGLPGGVLMENAGRGAALLLSTLGIHGPVVVCCGKGNNGGDGFVIARHLANHCMGVRVLLFVRPEDLSGDAAVHYRVLTTTGVPIEVHAGEQLDRAGLQQEMDCAEWVVDALFGTGLSGPVRAPFDQVIEAINDSEARVLAVDIPSGLDCDSGRVPGVAVRADHTATFVALKKGFAAPGAQEWLGKVHVLEIGVPAPIVNRCSSGQAP